MPVVGIISTVPPVTLIFDTGQLIRNASGVAVVLHTSKIESVPSDIVNAFAALLLILNDPIPAAGSMPLEILAVFMAAFARSAGFT